MNTTGVIIRIEPLRVERVERPVRLSSRTRRG
jgi:hypothetical protein